MTLPDWELLKSKRFGLIVAAFVLDTVVLLVPQLEPYRNNLWEMINTIIGLGIAGYTFQDTAIAFRTGFSKYNTGNGSS